MKPESQCHQQVLRYIETRAKEPHTVHGDGDECYDVIVPEKHYLPVILVDSGMEAG